MPAFSHIVRALGPLGLYSAARGLSRRHPRILMYHRFSDSVARGFVSRATLEWQASLIRRRFHPVSLSQLLEDLRAGTRPAPNTVVVTVDDGYRDFYDIGWPVLREQGVPATLFVTTGFVDGTIWLWPDQVAWILDSARSLPEMFVADPVAVRRSEFERWDKESIWSFLIDRLLELPDADKRMAVAALAQSLGLELPDGPPSDCAAVTWDHLREMQGEGLDVGGHTHTHPVLSRVPLGELSGEIDHCRERLDAELGWRPRPFCYPNGRPCDFNPSVRDRVERAGFTGAAVAYADGRPHSDLYVLARHSAGESSFHFRKVLSGLDWLGRTLRNGWASG